MSYLLDVNALMALGVLHHQFHQRVTDWIGSLSSADPWELVTCPLTELGFVRILAQTPLYGLTAIQAREILVDLKGVRELRFRFIPDDQDITHLPAWAKTPHQITDGHLLELARAKAAVLATLDRIIPGAFQIPFQP